MRFIRDLVMSAVACGACLSRAVVVDALDAQGGDITTITNSGNAVQTLERKWLINAVGNSKEVEELALHVPGRVFVSVSPTPMDTVAEVRVSGNSKELLDAFRVHGSSNAHDRDEDDDSSDLNELLVKLHTTRGFEAKGFLLTEVTLSNKAMLESLYLKGTADVMVDENVLFTSSGGKKETVDIEAMGTGNVYVSSLSTELSAESLKARTKGTGSILLALSNVSLMDEVELEVEGTGNVTLAATGLNTKKAVFDMSGVGNICVAASDLATTDLEVDSRGTGNVILTKTGTCKKGEVDAGGLGSVHVGSVVCESMKVDSNGMGKVVVQASDSLSVSGKPVEYTGVQPKTINPANGATKSTQSTPSDCSPIYFPTREPIEVTVKGGMVSQGSGPMTDMPSTGNASPSGTTNNNNEAPRTPSSTTSVASQTQLFCSAAAAAVVATLCSLL